MGSEMCIRDRPTVKTLSRIICVAGGGDEGRRIEGQHRREDKENQSQNPPAGYHRGGGEDKRRKPIQNGKVAPPTVPRGGRCLAENAYQKRKQNNAHHKGKKTKRTVLCYCASSHITLAAPWLGAEEGVGRTTKENEHEKPAVPCLCLTARLPRPWPRTEYVSYTHLTLPTKA